MHFTAGEGIDQVEKEREESGSSLRLPTPNFGGTLGPARNKAVLFSPLHPVLAREIVICKITISLVPAAPYPADCGCYAPASVGITIIIM